MSIWKEIRNNFEDEDTNEIFIDAWLGDNQNEEGKVIAKVNYITNEVEYIDERAKTDEYAQEMINEIINNL